MAVMQKSSMMQCRAVNSAQYPRAHKFTLLKNRNFVNLNAKKVMPSGIIGGAK